MKFTRQYLTEAGIACFLLVTAVLVRQPVLALGGAVLLGTLLARQVLFRRAVRRLAATARVESSFGRRRTAVRRPIPFSVTVSLEAPASGVVTAVAALPPGASVVSEPRSDRSDNADVGGVDVGDGDVGASDGGDSERGEGPVVTVQRGETEATTTVDLQWDVPGEYRVGPSRLSVTDTGDRFTATRWVGTGATLVVDADVARGVHVGRGGGSALETGSDHERGGVSREQVDLATVRPYVPGDSMRHIHWKATARLNELHTREFESESDAVSNLVVDCRSGLGAGRPGETKFDYLRYVALQLEGFHRSDRRSLGLVAIGDEGVIARVEPRGTAETYRQVHNALYRVGPDGTEASAATDATAAGGDRDRRRASRPALPGSGRRTSRTDVARLARVLDGESDFDRALRPFFEDRGRTLVQVDDDPLVKAVRSVSDHGGAVTILFTDDSRRGEVSDAVHAARRHGGRVVVFLAPNVLFTETEQAPELAYDRLTDFETFRRGLERGGDVTVYEVGPRDRLETVLSRGRRSAGAETPGNQHGGSGR